MKKAIIIAAVLAIAIGTCSFLFYRKEKAEQAQQAAQSAQDKWTIEAVKSYEIMGISIDSDSAYTEAIEALISDKLTYTSVPVSLSLAIKNENKVITGTDTLIVGLQAGEAEIKAETVPTNINGKNADLICEFDARDIAKNNDVNSALNLIKSIKDTNAIKYSIERK